MIESSYSFERVFPTSPDGTDWGIYGDALQEQWRGIWFEASTVNIVGHYAAYGFSNDTVAFVHSREIAERATDSAVYDPGYDADVRNDHRQGPD